MNNDEIFGYRCPVCKTINSAGAKNCYDCGHWLLDPDFPGEPLNRENYLRQIKSGKKNSVKMHSPKRFSIKRLFIGVAVALALLFIVSSLLSNQSNQQSKPTQTVTFEEFKATAADLPYDDLARNIEQHKGFRVHYTGTVVQVIENPPILRINVAKATPDKWFPNPEIIWITRKDNTGRVLENDTVEVWGTVKGPRTYKAVLGQPITIPEIESYYLTVIEKAGEK